MLTADDVRAQLPLIHVDVTPYRANRPTRVTGYITGRKNDFATVTFDWNGVDIKIEVAWSTCADVLNNGTALRY